MGDGSKLVSRWLPDVTAMSTFTVGIADLARLADIIDAALAAERAAREKAERERDEWRTKALDVEFHPVVKLCREERDAALALTPPAAKPVCSPDDNDGEGPCPCGKCIECRTVPVDCHACEEFHPVATPCAAEPPCATCDSEGVVCEKCGKNRLCEHTGSQADEILCPDCAGAKETR